MIKTSVFLLEQNSGESSEEKDRNIRFLEKENVNLMLETKNLRSSVNRFKGAAEKGKFGSNLRSSVVADLCLLLVLAMQPASNVIESTAWNQSPAVE